MRSLFYQANFCAECGNALTPRRSLSSRYYCDDCAKQFNRRRYFKPFGIGLLGATFLVFALNNRPSPPDATPPEAVASAQQATARQFPTPPVEEPMRTLCGARTLKGTPCRRLTLPGQRCSQHLGKPSLLPDQTAPQKNLPATQ